MAVKVEGLRELQRAFRQVEGGLGRELRRGLRKAGEPVRETAEQKAIAGISRIGPVWSRMRIGVGTGFAYVAPATRRRGGSPRPNLAGLLMNRSMWPAAEQRRPDVERELEHVIDNLGRKAGF